MQTLDRLLKVFHAVFEDTVDTDNLTPDASLREDIGINSIGLLYMAMAVEEEFDIKFTNEDFAGIVTVADVIRCIESKF
ncbi:MAG: acyl carrier protein [Oscillospiraceae bacterium]|nr:acyl carrier protein [Oscillospiraceae bacterium]